MKDLRDKILAADPNGRVVLPWNDNGEASVTMGDLQGLIRETKAGKTYVRPDIKPYEDCPTCGYAIFEGNPHSCLQ